MSSTIQEYTKSGIDALLATINSNITALNTALAGKANTTSLATVATSGAYSSLTGKPTIPATATDVGAVPSTRLVNSKALSADITLTASDVGAAPYLKAATASDIRFIGSGTALPASASVGDVFLVTS